MANVDADGNGEGMNYLSSVSPDFSGAWGDTIMGINEGAFLTTTATDNYNNTSEFSICASSNFQVALRETPFSVSEMKIYPNPCKEFVIVSVPEGTNSVFNFNILV